jgi:hypothetical protein
MFTPYTYTYDLSDMKEMIAPLGVLWHPMKGQEFSFTAEYLGFFWNIADWPVSLTEAKRARFKQRVDEFLHAYEGQQAPEKDVLAISRSLSHIAFVYTFSWSYLSSCSVTTSQPTLWSLTTLLCLPLRPLRADAPP